MRNILGIRKAAKERGITLISVARKLGMHRSNISAIASGARGVSLNILKKISHILDCSLDELVFPGRSTSVFKNKHIQDILDAIERNNYDGIDKSWVNRIMIAHRSHYRAAKRASK